MADPSAGGGRRTSSREPRAGAVPGAAAGRSGLEFRHHQAATQPQGIHGQGRLRKFSAICRYFISFPGPSSTF